MYRHIHVYDWNIIDCEVEQSIQLNSISHDFFKYRKRECNHFKLWVPWSKRRFFKGSRMRGSQFWNTSALYVCLHELKLGRIYNLFVLIELLIYSKVMDQFKNSMLLNILVLLLNFQQLTMFIRNNNTLSDLPIQILILALLPAIL